MEETEARRLIFCMWNDKWIRTSILLLCILFLFLTLTLSFLSGVIVLAAYATGFLVFNSMFSCQSVAPNPLALFVEKNLSTYVDVLKQCVVCGDKKCKRHKLSSHVRQPWQSLNIPEEVDEAIEDFLNKTLKEYVYLWYGSLSADENFVLELRKCVRYAASVLLHKALQIDMADIITKKLIPAGLSHLDDYLSCVRLAQRDVKSLESSSIQFLGPRLHPAARSRDNELAYLRCLTDLLLPNLLPRSQLDCKSYSVLARELLAGWVLLPLMDVLADPAIINSLLILLLSKHQLTEYPDKPGNVVEFLSSFVANPPASHDSALRVDTASILKNQDLLYSFMQFLKSQGSVNVLQFCLDVEEFNRKMLNPELTSTDLTNLHKEAWDLFSVYFSSESPDCLHFNPDVSKAMHSIILEPSIYIIKLRTTPPLFQAYEFAYTQLESTLCPLFHQSEEYYTYMCGQRQTASFSKSGNRTVKKWTEGGAVARISNRLHKIKGALRAQPVEGSAFDMDGGLDLGETEFAEDLHLMESSYRDLSAWRVSVPLVENQRDVNNKLTPVFIVDIQRIDVSSDDDPDLCHWRVERRYNDFYILDSKLTEFHGEFTDQSLPPKRLLFGPRGLEFMQSKRQVFEQYLQNLLRKPALRGSDLLHSFLRSTGEFIPGTGGEGIGRMIRRSVPLKLRKERGQHLEQFLGTLLASVENVKNKSSKYEWQDVDVKTRRKSRCLTLSIFGDNFGVKSQDLVNTQYSRNISIQGFFDSLLYLLVRVFGVTQPVLCLTLAVRTVCHDTVNTLVKFYLNRKLKKLLVAPRLAHLIRLLQGAIFNPKGPAATKPELEKRATIARDKLEGLLPTLLNRWIGDGYKEGVCVLFHALQNPVLNKQLAYTLFDLVAKELFPELDTGIISPSQV